MSNPTTTTVLTDDANAKAVVDMWNTAIEQCEKEFREHELAEIRNFHGPAAVVDNLTQRLENSAQGKLKNIVSQISPFFTVLEKSLILCTAVMAPKSIPLAVVAGGAYLTVKKCAEFEAASTRIVKLLDKIQKQIDLYNSSAVSLEQEHSRRGLVKMFIALIKFWVQTIRILRLSPTGDQGNRVIESQWLKWERFFKNSFTEIEEEVKFAQEMQKQTQSDWNSKIPTAQAGIMQQLPSVDDPKVFPCYEFPASEAEFFGRSAEMDTILYAYGYDRHATQVTKCNQTRHTVVISGIGGVGKSALALEVAACLKKAEHFDAMFWLSASSPDDLRESFNKIANRLLLEGATDKSDKDRNLWLVKNWLHKTKKTWLLIFDNVDNYTDVCDFLPPDTGSMMITTRLQAITSKLSGKPTQIQLQKFTPEESLILFNRFRQHKHAQAKISEEEEETKELLEVIDGLALGIKQMAFSVADDKSTMTAFRQKYDNMAAYILERNPDPDPAVHSLSTLWSVQFEALNGTNAFKLLALFSLCAPDSIPETLFSPGGPIEGADIEWAKFCKSKRHILNAKDALAAKALIEIHEGGNAFSIHRLTQEAFIYDDKFGLIGTETLQTTFDTLVALLARVFPRYGREASLMDHWDTCSHYISHVWSLARIYSKSRLPNSDQEPIESGNAFAELLKNATWYLQEIGESVECRRLLSIAIEACDKANWEVYAYLCNTYAALSVDENEMDEGPGFSEEAIKIRKENLEEDDLDLAISYNNNALLLLNRGDYEQAIEHHLSFDVIWAKKGKLDDIYRGLSYLNLGRVHSLRGQKGDKTKGKEDDEEIAAQCFNNALKIFEGMKNKSFLIGVHYTWATLLINTGDYEVALQKLQIALDLAVKEIPTQLVGSAIRYKIVEARMKGGQDLADSKAMLKAAKDIAVTHKREGHVIRIDRLAGLLNEKHPPQDDAEKQAAAIASEKAKEAKERLWSGIQKHIPQHGRTWTEEQQFNWLVAAWYR